MNTPILGILLVLFTAALVFGSAAVVLIALLRGRRPPLLRLALALGTWAAVYAIALVTTSLASAPRVLDVGGTKRFCGFYIDCHTHIAVAAIERLDRIGATDAGGVFYAVTLRVGSDAKKARLRLVGPDLSISDASARRFPRSPTGEAALAQARGPQRPLTDPLDPGDSYVTTVVFDVPRDARDARLHVTDGWWADRLIEFFLVGDEDSFLHEETSFRLTP